MGDESAADADAAVGEILQFLTLTCAVAPKLAALEYFLGMSTSAEGTDLILRSNGGAVISSVLVLTFADKAPPVVETCLKILTNLTVDEEVSWTLLNLPNHADAPKRLLKAVVTCLILSVFRVVKVVQHVISSI